jgi:hypothetical protein
MNNGKDESLRFAISEAFRHRTSLFAIIFITFALSIETPIGVLKVNAIAMASLIFPVAGTIVALALTAAGLASTFTLKLAADIPDIYENKAFPSQEKAQAIINRAEELQQALLPAWRGTLLVLSSFLLSAVALITPPMSVPLGMPEIRLIVDNFFSSASLGCVLVGTLSFIPTVRFSFRGKLLANLLNAARRLRERDPPTLSYLLQRARALKDQNPSDTYPQIEVKLCEEFKGRSFPLVEKLGLGEGEANGQIEDVTSGLSEIKRGINSSNWQEICRGIVRILEQDEIYKRVYGEYDGKDAWHDRSKGIERPTANAMSKWLPETFKDGL